MVFNSARCCLVASSLIVSAGEQWEKFLHVHESPYWVRIPLRYPVGKRLSVLMNDMRAITVHLLCHENGM
jgi:hypothetical protein